MRERIGILAPVLSICLAGKGVRALQELPGEPWDLAWGQAGLLPASLGASAGWWLVGLPVSYATETSGLKWL